MQTWCVYIDEAGVPYKDGQPNFVYAAICIPFNSQQEFLKSYPEIVNPLVGVPGTEIKYGPLLNTVDTHYRKEIEQICHALLTCFFRIENAIIIRVKAIKAQMRKKDDDLRKALFRKTLELCRRDLPPDHRSMILHDELPSSRKQQIPLFDSFNGFKEDPNFQNCVFVHSNENPFIQFADFVASICYRYYDFQKKEYKNKQCCKSLVNSLFGKIDECCPSIVELSEHKVVEDNPRREQALKLVLEHDIDSATAYNIVDENITLAEVLRRKQNRAARRQNEDERDTQTLGKLLKNRGEP